MYCDYADIRNGVDINYGSLLSTQLLLESVVLNWSTIKEAKVKEKKKQMHRSSNQKEVLLDSWRIYQYHLHAPETSHAFAPELWRLFFDH